MTLIFSRDRAVFRSYQRMRPLPTWPANDEKAGTIRENRGVDTHIDELARRYVDVEEYPSKGSDEGARVIVEIRPDRVATS